ncbi:bifunctional pyr operon transcriptional regulator/uracil phosphoribosyltransferase PyrR [Sulfidibacter corallicola]|uniref:Bifunctional pyr operon transcriptional regulator/uracil phosphoribosyltransferase PyrR n=1 Tax=Sulfidibacter corallicola TaxID=2818388 RepID=A0A8A4TIX8_SULCO|nr:bifunctional pyr operon transcriptional regulator/uracil phosphoribosyltransferase PyrR [Sulfidibacter corallicola]QTD49553.1 bifunctional pyr operon transcriptional regulator/uracil phosphoribosyltransferase PyrR [Sulfidibacter corallicola]
MEWVHCTLFAVVGKPSAGLVGSIRSQEKSPMTLKLQECYCDRPGLLKILDDLTDQILADTFETQDLAFVGILAGGAAVADYLAARASEKLGITIPVAYVDIHLYRDDVIDTDHDPLTRETEIPFALKNKHIVLVDDVLFTGRTVRAALTALLAKGRPRVVRLAVVVDRGFRELPIHADFVGVRLETRRDQAVRVRRANSPQEESGIYIFENAKS